MKEVGLIISPKTKIGELLDAFPELENVLLELSPAFSKLKNPVLRKTVGRVASLQQAAVVGGLKVDELVNRLRKEIGQDIQNEQTESSQYLSQTAPDWYKAESIVQRFDASPVINSGESPMSDILSKVQKLKSGEIMELKTPFVPAPIIDMLKSRGYNVFSKKNNLEFLNYIVKK